MSNILLKKAFEEGAEVFPEQLSCCREFAVGVSGVNSGGERCCFFHGLDEF